MLIARHLVSAVSCYSLSTKEKYIDFMVRKFLTVSEVVDTYIDAIVLLSEIDKSQEISVFRSICIYGWVEGGGGENTNPPW